METTPKIVTFSTRELAAQFCAIVQIARQMLLKPVAAVSILEYEGEYCGSLLVLYAQDATFLRDGTKQIPLAPYFYPGEVATLLESDGLLIGVHESRRTGIAVNWYEIGDISNHAY